MEASWKRVRETGHHLVRAVAVFRKGSFQPPLNMDIARLFLPSMTVRCDGVLRVILDSSASPFSWGLSPLNSHDSLFSFSSLSRSSRDSIGLLKSIRLKHAHLNKANNPAPCSYGFSVMKAAELSTEAHASFSEPHQQRWSGDNPPNLHDAYRTQP